MSGDTAVTIFRRLLASEDDSLSPAAAEAILRISFSDADRSRLGELSEKSTAGTLTSIEAAKYDGYITAADFLSLWKSKARLSLKGQSSAA